MPEFDAVLCGYDPRARDRFVSSAANEVLWHRANGYMLAPVLVDGRVGGYWRLEGTGRTKALEVSLFPGARRHARPSSPPGGGLPAALDVPSASAGVTRLDAGAGDGTGSMPPPTP